MVLEDAAETLAKEKKADRIINLSLIATREQGHWQPIVIP
jgi:hypothetical protein